MILFGNFSAETRFIRSGICTSVVRNRSRITPVQSHSGALMSQSHAPFAPKIYYFHPLIAGPRNSWVQHLRRCRELGFDFVLTAPLFAPGEFGDVFLTADHERVHPAIGTTLDVDAFAAEFADACGQHRFTDY